MSAIILSLPGIFLCIWYSSSAVLKLLSYQAALEEKSDLSLEMFHIYLHDILRRDTNWIMYSDEPEKSKIDVFNLNIAKGDLITMYAQADRENDRKYVPARLCLNSRVQCRDVEVRLRGNRHWHLLSRKKSLKIRVTDGKPFQGHETFNLVNHVSPMVVGQKIISDVADENNVMVPSYSFVRLLLNGEDLGVLHFQAQPDDSLFRRKAIMFSDFYSGDISSKADKMALWNDVGLWKKVTSRLHSNKHDVQRLTEFLHHITKSSYKAFSRFAKQHVNLEAFAAFEAIDVIFGIEQHGFRENQKLYFDPYIGSWVPVAWDLKGFKHDGVLNRVENPITIRLKMIPEYRALRNQMVWRLLNGDCSANRIRKRAKKQLEKIAPELANDRLFAAYKLLPKVNDFAFKMLRPMDFEKLNLVLESEMLSYERRVAFITNQLQKSEFYYRQGETIEMANVGKPVAPPVVSEEAAAETAADTDGAEIETVTADTKPTEPLSGPNVIVTKMADIPRVATDSMTVATGDTTETTDAETRSEAEAETPSLALAYRTPLDIVVAGESGISLKKITVDFRDCIRPEWHILQDGVAVATASHSTSAHFDADEVLYSSVALTERTKGDMDLSKLMVAPVPTRYGFELESNCPPENVEVFATHEITGNRVRAQKADAELLAQIPDSYPQETAVPAFEIGVLTPHPQSLTTPEITHMQFGPGIVEVDKTRVFDEYTHVTVMPGTVFEMGTRGGGKKGNADAAKDKVSLIFKGKVTMNGVEGNPIVFKSREMTPWGGIALQGRNTRGSVLSNVIFEDGSNIEGQPVIYTSMVNIHDTGDVTVSGCEIRNNHGPGDSFHSAYVNNMTISGLTVENATMDAVDIEFSSVEITRLFIRKTGDDGLDLMDSEITMTDSVILGCKQHGISVGENSNLKATDFLVAWTTNGIFGKDASQIEIGTGLLMRNQTGVRVGKSTGLYGGDVEVSANTLYVMGAKKLIARTDRKKTRLDDGKILYGFVDDRPLRHLFADVLDISGHEGLNAWLAEREVRQ
jgi:hypothetical protein